MSRLWRRNRTLPSPKHAFMPPLCMLPNGTSLYGEIRFAVRIELIALVTFRLLTTNAGGRAVPAYSSPPRTHVRHRVPNCDTHDISAIIIVFDVPSVTPVNGLLPLRWNMPLVAA